ncbi:MAG: fluoride efflux transporter CrcB [Pelagibacteraceae bacterium]|nr:fluoride efflux transporter CrcB [Pelagibacteraceae bacterium]
MKIYVLVALFGAIGSLGRYSLIQYSPKIIFLNFPIGTLLVNLIGSFLIGVVSSIFDKNLITNEIRTYLVFGFLGGFTTFSAFTYEFFNFLKNSEYLNAFLYIFLSVFLGLALFILGYKVIKIF